MSKKTRKIKFIKFFQVTLETFANFNVNKQKEEVLLKPAPALSNNDKYSALRDLLGDDDNDTTVPSTDIPKTSDILTANNIEEDDFGDFATPTNFLPIEPTAPKSLLPGKNYQGF